MLTKISNYEPSSLSTWQGRKDSLPGERFYQKVQVIDLCSQELKNAHQQLALLGFCSDEGIKRNEGRPGACQGPIKLREELAKLPCHSSKELLDVGNIFCRQGKLEEAQEQFAQLIQFLHKKGYKTLAFGGGHEIAWGHFLGLAQNYSNIGIINFDAHFDLRPFKKNYGTSGTPFRQIAEYCTKNQLPFNYCCLGIQSMGNTQSLFRIAKELQVSYLSAQQINSESLAWQIDFLRHFLAQQHVIYLTICLDVFAECVAPGVSAAQPMGLFPWQTLPLLKTILQTGKVISLDIAELSPPLDCGQKTARLAANLVAELFTEY